MHALVLPAVELWLESHDIEDVLPDWEARRRREALAADLSGLGKPMDPPIEPRFAFGEPDAAEIAGAAYVLEGSRLGSRLLALSVENQIEGLPTAFLTHGDDRRLWRDFLAALSALRLSPTQRERALLAADSVFAAYEDAFASVWSPAAA